MSPNRSFAVPPDLGAAIARLPDGDPAGRRTRAVARLLEAGLRPREIADLDIGGHRSAPMGGLDLDAPRVDVTGRKSRVVHLGAAAAADLAAFLEDRRAGRGAIAASHVEDAVAAVSAMAGVKLRAHEFRRAAAIRLAEAPTDADRRRTRQALEGPDPGGSP